MSIIKPFYSVKITAIDCGFVLAVNGCVEERLSDAEVYNQELPINQWLKDGENIIDIHMLNIPNYATGKLALLETGKLTLDLFVKEYGTDKKIHLSSTHYDSSKLKRNNSELREVIFNDTETLFKSIATSTKKVSSSIINNELIAKDNGEYQTGEYTLSEGITKSLQISHSVILPCPFPEYKFFQADELTYHEALSDEQWEATRADLIKAYQPIWNAIKDDDSEAMVQLFSARCSEYDQAFYTEEGQNLKELIAHLRSIIHDDVWTQFELDIENVDVTVAYNGKITWLRTWELPLVHAIKFKHTTAELEKCIPFMFSKFDGKWEIVR